MIYVLQKSSYFLREFAKKGIHPTDDVLKEVVVKNPMIVRDLQEIYGHVDEEIEELAVKTNIKAILRIPYPEEKLQLYVLEKDPELLGEMLEKEVHVDEEAIRFGLTKDGMMMKFVVKHLGPQSEELKWIAIRQNPLSIEFIRDATDEMKKEAVEANPQAINCIIAPTEDLREMINNPKLLKKLDKERLKKMKKTKFHDAPNRTSALVYIDGYVYTEENHAQCINQHKKMFDNKRRLRPSKTELKRFKDDVMIFAHVVDDKSYAPGDDYTNKTNCIYIMSHYLKNCTLQEAAEILKEKFPDYEIYDDHQSTIDEENLVRVYERLAKLYNKRMLKKWI
jgi:hypothetical protein